MKVISINPIHQQLRRGPGVDTVSGDHAPIWEDKENCAATEEPHDAEPVTEDLAKIFLPKNLPYLGQSQIPRQNMILRWRPKLKLSWRMIR